MCDSECRSNNTQRSKRKRRLLAILHVSKFLTGEDLQVLCVAIGHRKQLSTGQLDVFVPEKTNVNSQKGMGDRKISVHFGESL